MPQLSVIIPVFNRIELLVASMASVQRQTFRDYEVIIVDDGSTEDVASVVRGFGDNVRLVTRPRNGGIAITRNDGIEAARGEYCAFLDSDDVWMPWTLQLYSDLIREHRGPSVIAAAPGKPFVGKEQPAIDLVPRQSEAFTDYFTYVEQHQDCGWLLPSGLAVRTDVLREMGGFRVEFRHCEDDEIAIRLGRAPGFVRVQQPLTVGYRVVVGSLSKNIPGMIGRTNDLVDEERNRRDIPEGDRAVRRFIIAQKARHLARLAVRTNRPDLAWAIYWKIADWNVRLKRWAFLLGMPFEVLGARFARVGHTQSVPLEAAGS